MTGKQGTTSVIDVKALLDVDGDYLRAMVRAVVEATLEAEMTAALGVEKGERSEARLGYRSGYYTRTLITRVGTLELRVPQDRDGRFSTRLFERYQRSEKALVGALAEMYVQGVSTRKVKAITEELCGHAFSASAISDINKTLDAELAAFAGRRLEEAYPYLILDARYERVREAGVIRSQAVLIAIGVDWEGRRNVLGVEMADRESRTSWKAFLAGLRERGLAGVEFVVSDDHEGLKRAIREMLPEAAWQRCYVGLLKKAGGFVHCDLIPSARVDIEVGRMLGRQERRQLEFFVCGSLRDLVPDDHILARVDRVLDLSWLRAEVADLYCEDIGRPGIDPEVAVRLMLAGFLLGIVHDRRLMREAQVNLAIRWFAGYGLHERLPDHSSLTRIRQRWGAERFRRIFERTVQACVAAKIAKGEIVHVDASLIRADVSWESLAVRHADAVVEANDDGVTAERDSRKGGKPKKVCVTDPDASMATNGRNRRLEPSYKQHAVVDDAHGVVLDVEVTTGEVNEGQVLLARIDAVAASTGAPVQTVTADAGYAYAKIYGGLERREIAAVIPAKAEPIRSPVPLRRFRYDARHDILKCPRGKILRPTRPVKHGRFFYSRAVDCKGCDLAALCLSRGRANKAVVVGDDYPALLRARRRRERWTDEDHRLYQRHRWRSEGYHGEAKTWHGLARAVRRGLSNMQIQAYLTAAAVNLKRLAAALLAICSRFGTRLACRSHRSSIRRPIGGTDAAGTEQAPNAFFNSPYVHFLRNALDHLPRKADDDCLQELRWLYDRRELAEARQDLARWLGKWQAKYPKLCDWVEVNIEETLTFYRLPRQHHKHLKSTNMLERLNQELKRRTRVVRIFPSAESCLRLIRALAVETHENWLEAIRYLNMAHLAEHKKEALRKLEKEAA